MFAHQVGDRLGQRAGVLLQLAEPVQFQGIEIGQVGDIRVRVNVALALEP